VTLAWRTSLHVHVSDFQTNIFKKNFFFSLFDRRVLFKRGCALATTSAESQHRIGHSAKQPEPGPRRWKRWPRLSSAAGHHQQTIVRIEFPRQHRQQQQQQHIGRREIRDQQQPVQVDVTASGVAEDVVTVHSTRYR